MGLHMHDVHRGLCTYTHAYKHTHTHKHVHVWLYSVLFKKVPKGGKRRPGRVYFWRGGGLTQNFWGVGGGTNFWEEGWHKISKVGVRVNAPLCTPSK